MMYAGFQSGYMESSIRCHSGYCTGHADACGHMDGVMSQSSANTTIVIWCIAAAIYEKKHIQKERT